MGSDRGSTPFFRWRCAPPLVVLGWAFGVVFFPSGLQAQDSTLGGTGGSNRVEASRLADEYVACFLGKDEVGRHSPGILEAEARGAFLERIVHRAEAGSPSGPNPAAKGDSRAQALAEGVFERGQGRLAQGLVDAERELTDPEPLETLADRWRTVRANLYDRRFQVFEHEATKSIQGQAATLFSVDSGGFWLCGLLAIAGLVGVVFVHRRHEIRRMLNGGRARQMGLAKFLNLGLVAMTVLTLVVFFGNDAIYRWFLRAGADTTSPSEKISREIESAQGRLDRAQSKVEAVRRTLDEKTPETTDENSELASKQRDSLERLAVGLEVRERTAEKLAEDVAALREIDEQLVDVADDIAALRRRKHAFRGGLGLVLVGLSAAGGVFFLRGARREHERTRDTCPLCLLEGGFQAVENGYRGPHAGVEMAQCKSVISEDPYEECDFTFAAEYRDMPRLCFPTLGVPRAGKTHWLAMAYRQLNKGNYPQDKIQFEKIRSATSEEFDDIVDDILNKKMGPGATQVKIPHPLIFNFLDRDRLSPSSVLMAIFDYSGEVTRFQTLADRQRQRALEGDGFFFFLDPTEPSDTQLEPLERFREDLRHVKKVKMGKQLRSPVALCVPKIDMLLAQVYAAGGDGSGVIDHFYRGLADVGWNMDLASIEARGKLMAQLRDTIWPDWQIEKKIDDLFGGRYMFFPLTPVGLDGVGRGDTSDLSRRVISPLGVLHPLMWLLHMNGYPVLK